jgi:rare lipoprotein A
MNLIQQKSHRIDTPHSGKKIMGGTGMLQSSQIKRALCLGVVGLFVTACASHTPETTKKKRSKEYFAESVYGVKASPRVAHGGKIPRGGGRDQLGKPYKVKDKWYKPKEDKNYKKSGRASWYGSAFHGRLTANGEVYDMTHLTAAHPTMPLPSYARVTNTANGSSVIVRVNDRGPYSNDRIIDMSEKAAEMLDYKHHGTADVKVEYVGRAPLDGQDDAFLLASYRSGKDSIGQPATGVMMAMNGPTPTTRPQSTAAFNQIAPQQQQAPQQLPFGFADGSAPQMPAFIPVPLDKPYGMYNVASTNNNILVAAYGNERIAQASEGPYSKVLMPQAVSAEWRQEQVAKLALNSSEQGEYVDLGSFTNKDDADRITAALRNVGTVNRSMTAQMRGDIYTLTAKSSKGDNDALLQAAWAAGAADAFVVRAE